MDRKEYWYLHRHIEGLFGKASEWQCLLCFDLARDWAWLWRTHPDQRDPYSYVAMCRQDHVDYDKERTSPQLSDKLKGNKRRQGKMHTPETKAKMSKAKMGNQNLLGHRHSEETRAKMRAAHARRRRST